MSTGWCVNPFQRPPLFAPCLMSQVDNKLLWKFPYPKAIQRSEFYALRLRCSQASVTNNPAKFVRTHKFLYMVDCTTDDSEWETGMSRQRERLFLQIVERWARSIWDNDSQHSSTGFWCCMGIFGSIWADKRSAFENKGACIHARLLMIV